MEPRAGVALWNITDSLDRVYHESRRSSPIRWSVESVVGNVIVGTKVPHTNPGKTCFTHALLKPNATLPDAHCHLLGDGRVGVRQYRRRRQRRACHDDDEAAQNHSNCRRTQVNR